jgi:hypothetical protein
LYVILLFGVSLPLQADIILTDGQDIGVDVSPVDGSIAMDLMGSIWTMPSNGGQARQLTDGQVPAMAPRWSPDGTSIIYQVPTASGTEIWRLDVGSAESQRISDPNFHNQDPSWHPQGERIVFSSDRDDSGLDIWETDLPTGLSWRITSNAGDETEPAWSRNGRHLVYIQKTGDQFALVLRRLGEADQELVNSSSKLSSPSWRPDGSLVTYLRHSEDGPALEMVILSDPPLVRVLAAGEDYFSAPVSWRDRTHLIYTADGAIKTRGFEDRRSRRLRFRAILRNDESPAPRTIPDRELSVNNPPRGRLVIRGARLFDGIWPGYREQIDVVIEDGIIVAVEPRRDWEDATVLDPGNVTVLPGLIDSWSGPPGQAEAGPAILSYGVTTIVSASIDDTIDRSAWDGEQIPGPRILPAATVSAESAVGEDPAYFLVNLLPSAASIEENRVAVQKWRDAGVPVIADNWTMGRQAGADILLGAGQPGNQPGPSKGAGKARSSAPPIIISGLADAGAPGIASLLESRQAVRLGQTLHPSRRITEVPRLEMTSAMVVAGSLLNGLPPGQALHAELRALRSAGLNGEQTLHTAGRNAATMLGLDNQIGTITPGAMADLLLVAGDPLESVDDLLRIVAVVRNGRFFSLVSLLERAEEPTTVE